MSAELGLGAGRNAPMANLEAEQALLGCLIYDNSAHERVPESLTASDFFEPFHGALWDAISLAVAAGKLADPILLGQRFEKDKAFQDLGGLLYLANLIDKAPPSQNAADYAELVEDLAMRRRLEGMAQDVQAQIRDMEVPAKEILEAHEQSLFQSAERKRSQGLQSFQLTIANAIAHIAAAHERGGGLSGLSTGLLDLDAKVGGLHQSDLIILAARPSMGKTALAANIAFDVAKHYQWQTDPSAPIGRKTTNGGVVAFFSLEMSSEQLATRLLASVSDIDSERLRRGQINSDQYGRLVDAAQLIQDAPLYIDATGGISIAALCARARRLKRTVGLELVVVDYLQLVTASKARHGANRVEEVSEITQGLKALAKELNVPVLALSQLSRQVEQRDDKRPQLADLRESGSIEQDADMVWFVYREEYYLSRTEPKENSHEHDEWQILMTAARGRADIIIGKQRHGPIGTVQVAFDGSKTQFSNLAKAQLEAQARLPHSED